MNWLDPETAKGLTPGIVLLGLMITLGTAWVRDRNARIKDLQQQVTDDRNASVFGKKLYRRENLGNAQDYTNPLGGGAPTVQMPLT